VEYVPDHIDRGPDVVVEEYPQLMRIDVRPFVPKKVQELISPD
jgi:hypothetical protein